MKVRFYFDQSVLRARILKDQLDLLGINYKEDEYGVPELASKPNPDDQRELSLALQRYGLEILEKPNKCFVQRVKDIIVQEIESEKPPRKTLSSVLCDEFGCSYTHIASMFVTETLVTIEKFTLLMRIEKVKQMITAGEMTIKEICDRLHYSSSGHLSKQFKKVTGLTITQFKNISARWLENASQVNYHTLSKNAMASQRDKRLN
ncbi:MAG: AraC family transcriptional regulator [Flavobacterium sp.]|uniref:helix-turn-helix domain-containing protein n=1 Tax=Flavobacterium sp. TaxID=239 RepID=UPI00120619E8|nr:AraC family transcriptional regulator [Flavobacterium sp.]RZJ66285.1 MAG: AraC family transcriptional regulator [Flavobacterium sp.]